MSKCYPPALELIPLFLLGLAFYLAIDNYPSLPSKIPIDFNSQGIATDWANKSMIFLYPGLGVFIYLLFTTATVLLAVLKNPKSIINLPRKWKDSLNESQTEKLRVTLNLYLFLLKVLIIGLMFYLLYASIEVALVRSNTIVGAPFTILMIAIFAVVFFMLWETLKIVRMVKINNRSTIR